MPKATAVTTDASGQALSKSALRRQREREQRFESILSAAEGLFAELGYHKASMEQIADAAEVSVGAVYFYFKNKEDLLVHLMERIGFHLRVVLGEAFKKEGPSLDGIKAAGKKFFEDFCVNYPEQVAIIFRESAGQSPQVEERRKKIFNRLTGDILGALQQIRSITQTDFTSQFSTEVIAACIIGIYERVAYEYLFWQDRRGELTQVGADAVEFIVGGINVLMKEGACT